ncbi:DUF3597 domain-containing protein [Lichenibacterium ramalinae]|uniref:DUF3597 domain-containing protein n=1 Tax=Lichenibacterium ramalinae TaxID=2316527 RepID=A0A4Q2RJP8_9HYPH|nr:DUF3597 domain-containing protein [Lichenibacterium ramalinae]RYB06668.1 DUF3597 domain-containing protein [Lichenibacterium ramalinae]
MSIFGNIVSKLFHHAAAPTQVASADTSASADAPASAATTSDPAPAGAGATTPPAAGSPTAAAAPASGAAASVQGVDVAAVLEGLAAKNPQKLDWRHSIVDMMKLLDLDSSLSARKELATELHYSGDTNDSAAMNVWLHSQVMKKLAENGGKVPDDLKG